MNCCTFYGHRHTPDRIYATLEDTVRKMIEDYGVEIFYVGDKGNFDHMAAKCVKKLQEEYPHVRLYITLAYMPDNRDDGLPYDTSDTLYPDGLEFVPRRFAIVHRNRWMAKQCQYAIVNISGHGGAANAAAYADKQGVKIINISDEVGREYFTYHNALNISNH